VTEARTRRHPPPTVAIAISGHGFGHAVRSAEVARALLNRGVRVMVRTDAPRWLFPPETEVLPCPAWPLDIGVAQHDSLELNVDETRQLWQAFGQEFEAHAAGEAELLHGHDVDMVVGDIPPLAFAASAAAGLPGVAVGNFGWDWIYAAWPRFEAINQIIRDGYARADVLLRLPLHSSAPDAFAAFRRIEDVPLVARRARRSRAEVRRECGLAESARVVLLSFGGFTARGLDLQALGRWNDYVFVLTPPISAEGADLPANLVRLNQTPADYVSLIAATDVVVTKPGYGIVVDCLAHRIPLLFTDRGPFREYDVLADALPRLGRAQYIPRDELLAGELGPRLDALLNSSAAWTEQPMNGADVIAERVLDLYERSKEVMFR